MTTNKISSKYPTLILILLIAFALRVYRLNDIPNGLFTDEAARGYDAFAIAQTGADMFGVRWPLFFRGFNDFTAGLYVYLTVPFVFLLDLSPFTTRLASAWVGLLTVVVSYWAIRRPFGHGAGLAGAALLGLSPWYVLLSRIGTEWNLLALGPMLTIVLAYRGLKRPRWLLAAGAVGGLTLYGYAPVKVFLPLLLIIFTLFYWRALLAQKWATIGAGLLFTLLALPVYSFSFTSQGLTRFQEVALFYNLSWPETLQMFGRNYMAYFNPWFLFGSGVGLPNVFFIQRLKEVGLLYLFELPLILLGLILLFRQRRRDRYFWLCWLLIAPVGINLHVHSPKPALWLAATPTLHGLAGAGLAYLIVAMQHGLVGGEWLKIEVQRRLTTATLVVLLVIALINIKTMLTDLFTEFPQYATQTRDWGIGMEQGVQDLVALAPAFDQANLDTFGLIDAIYVAYYTRWPPHQRQAEVARHQERAWQQIGDISVGQVETLSQQPGCHLSLTRSHKNANIAAPHLRLQTYGLPAEEPLSLGLSVIATPADAGSLVETVFGEQILLDRFNLVATKPDSPAEVEPGQALCLILEWQSQGNLPADYTVFVHLVGPFNPATNGPLWAQHDGVPVDGQRPTLSWQPGEIIRDLHVLLVPVDAPESHYQLKAGLYNTAGERLSVQQSTDPADQITLLEFDVRCQTNC